MEIFFQCPFLKHNGNCIFCDSFLKICTRKVFMNNAAAIDTIFTLIRDHSRVLYQGGPPWCPSLIKIPSYFIAAKYSDFFIITVILRTYFHNQIFQALKNILSLHLISLDFPKQCSVGLMSQKYVGHHS